jgi:hypothetical protein
MDVLIIVLIIAVLAVLAGGFMLVIRRPAPTPAPTKPIRRVTFAPTDTPIPTTPAPTPAPTSNSQLAIPLAYTGLAPLPPGPPMWYVAANTQPQYNLVPGAAWPILVGRNRETVSYWLMNTYPRLRVHALPLGSPTFYEARSDRITILFDPYTNRVVNARIG